MLVAAGEQKLSYLGSFLFEAGTLLWTVQRLRVS